MIARDIKEDDEFWDDDRRVWVALSDANVVKVDGEKLARVLVQYWPDGGRGYRHWEPDQIVKVRRGAEHDVGA